MSDNSDSTRQASSLGRYKFVWLSLLPLVAILAVVVYWSIPEWIAAQQNQVQFKKLAAEGIPYDNATMQQTYEQRTHPEGTSDWVEISQLAQWGQQVKAYQKLPYLGGDGVEVTNLVSSGKSTDWPDKARVASYLEEMEPVIDLIERASAHPTPVRFPIRFDGISTLLPHVQNARGIQRLLVLDCDFAYFNQDNERALRDLSLMQATVDAYDGRETLVSALVNVAIREMRMGEVRRTLTHCQWSAADLEVLRDSLSLKEKVSARWRDNMLCERAFGLSIVNESPRKLTEFLGRQGQFRVFTGPSEVRALIKAYQKLVDLSDGQDLSQWRKRAAGLEEWVTALPSNSLAGMILPAGTQCLEAEIRAEDVRRWTLTAVAIQQFKQQNEQWPQELSDLESVGLNYEDYSTMDNRVFGYEIEGDKVFLWKQDPYDSTDKLRISEARPLPEKINDGKKHDMAQFLLELN